MVIPFNTAMKSYNVINYLTVEDSSRSSITCALSSEMCPKDKMYMTLF